MILLILGMTIIISLLLFIVVPDNYSDWNEEYMDDEFERLKKLKSEKDDSK